MTLNYDRDTAAGYLLGLSLNDTYRSAMPLSTFPLVGQTQAATASSMNIANASASLTHDAWRLGLYVTNIMNKRVIESPGTLTPYAGSFDVLSNQAQLTGINVRVVATQAQ